MAAIREWFVRLWGTLSRGRRDADLERELRAHLELAAADAALRDPGAARAAAIRFGGVPQAMETLRDQRGLRWLEDLGRDVRHAGRACLKSPGFTAIAVTSLAIGIGVNCAVFSFADALLLRPLAVANPDALITVGVTNPAASRRTLTASYREYLDLRQRIRSFDSVAAFTESAVAMTVDARSVPRPRIGLLVSGNFFTTLGVPLALGRSFRPEEDQVPGRDPVLVLGHEFWMQQFGGDPGILGRAVRLNGLTFSIVGVAPPEFTGIDQYTRYEFYAPLMMWPRLLTDVPFSPLEARDFRRLTLKARLAPGVSRQDAQTELSVLQTDLAREYPATNRPDRLVVQSELQNRIAQSPPAANLIAMLAALSVAVFFVSCANVAGLFAARAPVRAREVALRLAVGASRSRVVRELMVESLAIALAGGVLGLAIGYAGVLISRQFRIPTDLPIAATFQLDRRALVVSFFVALASAAVFGLWPAIRAARTNLTSVLKATDARTRQRGRGTAILVTLQITIAVVLLATATFMYRGFRQRLDAGPGFRTDHRLLMYFSPTLVGLTMEESQHFFDQAAERVRQLPGVRSVTLTSSVPTDGRDPVSIVPEGFPFPEGRTSASMLCAMIDAQYFATLDVRLLRGRAFTTDDKATGPRVAIVNEEVARKYWPGEDPIGKRFRLSNATGPWVEIVGLAKTGKYSTLLEPPTEFVYFPYLQRPQSRMALVVESVDEPAALIPAVRTALRDLDPNQPVYNLRLVDEVYRLRTVVVLDIVVSLVAGMGLMGLALAIVGLYGLVAYAANRRTREIGIRMAIGAGRGTVLTMVLRQGLTLALVGLGVGLVGGAGVQRALGAVFPGGVAGDGRTDVVAFFLVAGTVLTVTLLAAYVPARRASRLDPTIALRYE